MDKKTLHESLRDDESGLEQPHDGGPQSAHDQHRRDVLLRVVRISDALNQRLAL